MPFGAAGGTSSLLVTSAAGDIVFDIFDAFKISSGLTSNQSAGQTLIANSGVFDLVAGGVATYPGFGSYQTSTRPGAASVAMGWTSTADVLLAAAINIEQASITAQTITFNAPPNTALSGGSVALGATASSGLTVAYTSNTTSICTISGSNAVLVAVGSCSITADQAGNGSFAAAPPVTRMFNVTCPTITVNPATLPRGTAGTAYNQSVNASGGSGAVSFNVSAGGVPGGSLASSGRFSGAPYLFGPFSLTVTATDSIGCTESALYNVNIRQNPAVHRALTDLRGR